MRLNSGYLYGNKFAICALSCIDLLLKLYPRKKKKVPSVINKVLLIKPDHLGDMLLLTSILPLLAKKFPNAMIDIICSKGSSEILKDNPWIRNKHCIDHPMLSRQKQGFFQFWKRYLKIRKTCKEAQYDLCLLMRPFGGNFILLGRAIKPKCLIGHGTAGFRKFLDIEVKWNEGVHETQHFLEVLAPLGVFASKPELEYELFPSDQDLDYVDNLIEKMGLGDFLVIHPFCGDQRKTMDLSLWIELMKREKGQIVVCGSKKEQIEFPKNVKPLYLMGQLSIPQLFLFYKKAKKIYSLDSFSAHLAGLSKTQSFVLCNPSLFSEQWRPLGNKISVLTSEHFLKNL